MNLVLCGLPKSGKTTLGRQLAKKLDWQFLDSDQLLEDAYAAIFHQPLTCREIFQKHGEVFFRELERDVIAQLPTHTHTILAVGGGALQDPENQKRLKAWGAIIHLSIPRKLLLERLTADTPAFLRDSNLSHSLEALEKERLPIYQKLADYSVETNDEDKIYQWIISRRKSNAE